MPSCCVAASPETANLAFARPGSPTAEAEVLNTFQCGFESHPGHQHFVNSAHRDASPTFGLGPSRDAAFRLDVGDAVEPGCPSATPICCDAGCNLRGVSRI